ncbi:hypothetical protein FACS1894105_12890 [Clostridia bacterium]|nr:hypothetical protein FACS1894105_12890 [Clostridia bacterium]
MKKNVLAKMALTLGLTAMMALSPLTAMAADTPKVARTKAWDGITETLGGIPEKVSKIEYSGSVFYLASNVTDKDFLTVLAAGADAVKLKPPTDNGKLYQYPVYILWNKDKTALLVHPIIWDYDDVLEAVATPADPPASLTDAKTAKPTPKPTPKAIPKTAAEIQEYMLSDEYADEVRTEFYKLLNEHRTANGLKELEIDLKLQAYADIRADEQRERFGHTRPDGSAAGSGWNNAYNVMNSRYAENALKTGAIGADPKSAARGIFSIWKNSKGHNRHMLYDFDPQIKMALGIAPKLEENGTVTSGAIFATGYER